MPLGQREGDSSESRYCGAEVAFSSEIHRTLAANLSGGFDFIVAPLVRLLTGKMEQCSNGCAWEISKPLNCQLGSCCNKASFFSRVQQFY